MRTVRHEVDEDRFATTAILARDGGRVEHASSADTKTKYSVDECLADRDKDRVRDQRPDIQRG